MARSKKVQVNGKAAAASEAVPATLNKAKAVRAFFAKNPKMSPKDVSAALMAQGLDINAAYVSIVKFQMKKARRKQRAAAGSATPATKATGAGDTFSVETLMQAKKLSEALGGVDAARQALSALSKLLG